LPTILKGADVGISNEYIGTGGKWERWSDEMTEWMSWWKRQNEMRQTPILFKFKLLNNKSPKLGW
jgi:hypothetical protein